jgi:Domain of unknown function (DUF4375)
MVEPGWASLEDLDDDQLQAALLEYLDAVMARQPAQAEDVLLAALPRPLQVLWLLNWLEFEVAQGSLLAYFFNRHGRHAALAVAALQDIGAGHMAQVLKEAAVVVAAHRTAWDKRRSDLDAHPEWTVTQPYRGLPQAETLGGSITSRFWEAAQTDDWGEKLDEFVRRRVAPLLLGASSATDPGQYDHPHPQGLGIVRE